ncbi:hypothetical protein FXO37_29101 [Capsicum annuum]|nr:hypothetical protein FXO37_29101 [Capsicum annuum]
MESYEFDAYHTTSNGILDASTSSTPADMPTEGRSTESIDGSGELTTKVVNQNMQTIVSVRSPHFTKENEGELGEDGIDRQDLTAANIGFNQSGSSSRTVAPFERGEYILAMRPRESMHSLGRWLQLSSLVLAGLGPKADNITSGLGSYRDLSSLDSSGYPSQPGPRL